jgi:hypothetical protein
LGDARDVTHDYDVAPLTSLTLGFNQFPNISFSGFNLNLSSQLNRAVTSGTGTATLVANNSFRLTEANFLEWKPDVHVAGFFKNWLEAEKVSFSLGPRYTQVSQDYHATLTSASNNALLNSHQDFTGFGVTSSVEARSKPWVRTGLQLYGNLRGSLLVGTNNKNSTASTTVGSAILSSSENRTDYIPIGELELGVEWGTLVGVLRGGSVDPDTGTIIGARVGFVGQVIGDVGLPSASSRGAGALDNGAVYLVGVGLLFELRH